MYPLIDRLTYERLFNRYKKPNMLAIYDRRYMERNACLQLRHMGGNRLFCDSPCRYVFMDTWGGLTFFNKINLHNFIKFFTFV